MNTNCIQLATSPWASSDRTREQFGIAPNASVQGSGLPYGSTAAYVGLGFASKHAPAMTLAAVRLDDARVPEPRGRLR